MAAVFGVSRMRLKLSETTVHVHINRLKNVIFENGLAIRNWLKLSFKHPL